MRGEEIVVCEWCRGPVKQPCECRPRPEEPIHVFCSPECRNEFADGYGFENEKWPEP